MRRYSNAVKFFWIQLNLPIYLSTKFFDAHRHHYLCYLYLYL